MRRLYFLLPDTDCAPQRVDDLLLARVEERHMHLTAKEGVALADLPEAGIEGTGPTVPAFP